MAVHKLLVDTNILYNNELCLHLAGAIRTNQLEVYIPAIVHAERIRQVADEYGKRFSINVVHQYLDERQFQILPFTAEQAEAIADLWIAIKSSNYYHEGYWRKNRFDIVLCAVAYSTGYMLVAEDGGKHFDLIERRKTNEITTWLNELIG